MYDTQQTHLQTWSSNITSSNQTKTQLLIIVCLTETNTFSCKSSICALNFTCYDRDSCPALEVNEFIIPSTRRQRKAGWSFLRPQNISGASRRNGVAAFIQTTEADGGWKAEHGSIQVVWHNISLQKLWDPNLIWTDIIYTLGVQSSPRINSRWHER